jgi:tape measure domain-containing protein
MQQLIRTAATTPFDMTEVANGAKQLLAYGTAAEEVNDILVRLGDIAAGLSVPLGDLVYLYGTTMTQGRMFTQDLRQFMGRGIPLAEELAKQFGVTKDKVGELVTAGKVGAEEFKKAIMSMTDEGSKFGGLMEAQSKALSGQISNIEDGVEQMINDIGKQGEGLISDTLSVVSLAVENYRELGQAIGEIAVAYGAYRAALVAMAAVQAVGTTVSHSEEARQIYELMGAEAQERVSKLGLLETTEAYYQAVMKEAAAEKERTGQLAISTAAEREAAAQALATREAEVLAAQERVATAQSEALASLEVRKAKESEAQSRAALNTVKLEERKQALIQQATDLKEKGASAEKIAAKNREIAAISRKIEASKAEEIQHSQNVVAIRKEIEAVNAGTIAKSEHAEVTKLLTAQEQLSTAAKNRDTAASALNTAASKAEAAAKEADAVATGIDTAAKTANVTATAILEAAMIRLYGVLKRVYTLIMSNPYTFAAAAVVSLAYGVYKLATYQTEAEKSAKRLNDAWQEADKSITSETTQVGLLFNALKAAKEGTQQYADAKKAIMDKYGQYLEGLSNEIRTLQDVEGAYNAITIAATKAARARAMESFTAQENENYINIVGGIRKDISELLVGKFGDVKGNEYFQQIASFLEGGQLTDEVRRVIGQFDESIAVTNGQFGGTTTYTVNRLQEYITKAANARKDLDKTMADARTMFGSFYTEEESTGSTAAVQEQVKDKKYYENIVKDLTQQYESLTVAERTSRKGLELYNEIVKNQDIVNGWNISSSTSRGNEQAQRERQKAELLEKIDQYRQEVSDAERQAQLDIRQAALEAEKDGIEKQIKQNELNYERLKFENEKREREMVERMRDTAEAQWEIDNPNARKEGRTFDRSTITAANLSDSQKGMIKAYAKVAEDIRVQANREALDSMLAEVQTYEQQRLKITEDYERRRKALYVTDVNGNRRLRDGVTQGNLDELNRQEQEALSAVDQQFASREDQFKAWCDEIGNLALWKLREVLEQAERELDGLEKSGTATDTQLAQARAKVRKATEAVRKQEATDNISPEKRDIKQWEDLYKVLNECEREFESLGDAIGGTVGEVMSSVGTMSASVLTIINGITQFGEISADTIEASSAGAARAIAAVEKASVILTVISAAFSIASKIASLFNDDESKQRQIERLQGRIDQLQWELDNQDIVRIQEAHGKAVERVRKAMESVRRELVAQRLAVNDFWGAYKVMYNGISAYQPALEKSARSIADAYASMSYTVDKALGSGKFSGVRSDLDNIAKQQILIQEQIDKENSKKKTDKSKIADWEKTIEELGAKAVQMINDLVEDIIGNSAAELADELSEAFFDAFSNGEDYAVAWGDKVKDIVADITRRMLVSKFLEEPLGKVFDKYKERWFPNGEGSNTIDLVLDSMGDFAADLQSVGRDFAQVFDSLPDNVRNMIVGSAETAEREGAKKGIAQASQESVDELNGRTTAIQSHTYSINENTRLLLATANLILRSVMGIESNTDSMDVRLGRMEADMKEVKNTVSDIALKGIRIK